MRFKAMILLVSVSVFLAVAFSQTAPKAEKIPPCLGRFASHQEAEDFLRTAKIVKSKALSVGVTGPQKLTLEKDGREEFGVFKSIDERKPGIPSCLPDRSSISKIHGNLKSRRMKWISFWN
jgi:hypothetical protein